MMLEHPNERTRHTHSCVIKRKTSFKFKQVILLIFFEIFNTIYKSINDEWQISTAMIKIKV